MWHLCFPSADSFTQGLTALVLNEVAQCSEGEAGKIDQSHANTQGYVSCARTHTYTQIHTRFYGISPKAIS